MIKILTVAEEDIERLQEELPKNLKSVPGTMKIQQVEYIRITAFRILIWGVYH